jgi:hypothetical protein
MKTRSEVYDTYWYFAAERQRIFFKRLRQEMPPYTQDPILTSYKFCNVYRACDRVSQFLIRQVIYDHPFDDVNMLFRIFLFRLFNKHETWIELVKQVGEISLNTFSAGTYAAALEDIRLRQPIYGNAFILCANKAYGFDQKHRNHLALLEHVFVSSEIGSRLADSECLEHLFRQLKSLPLIGNFMAYQIAIDMNYSTVFDFDEDDFTVAGPGALRGIAKCFEATGTASPADIIRYMVQHQDEEFDRLGLNFQSLGGRKLHAIDCQGLFCEVDKYCRVKFPDIKSNRTRIKASYKPTAAPIDFFFPPKWKIRALQESSTV